VLQAHKEVVSENPEILEGQLGLIDGEIMEHQKVDDAGSHHRVVGPPCPQFEAEGHMSWHAPGPIGNVPKIGYR
jgi:hypothetical protein